MTTGKISCAMSCAWAKVVGVTRRSVTKPSKKRPICGALSALKISHPRHVTWNMPKILSPSCHGGARCSSPRRESLVTMRWMMRQTPW